MSREIKFRAWDSELKLMVEPSKYLLQLDGRILFNNEGELIGQTNKLKVMQFTGLRDRNGKDIYEGDIVFWKDGSENPNHWRYAKVEYYDTRATFCFTIVKCGTREIGYQFGAEHSFGGYDEIEVIGNIYDNPELLK